MYYCILLVLIAPSLWAQSCKEIINEEIISSSCPLAGLSLPENYSYDLPEGMDSTGSPQKGKTSPLNKGATSAPLAKKKEMTLEERKLASPRAARRRRSTRDKASEMCEGCKPKVTIEPTKEKPKPIDDIHQHDTRGPGLFTSGKDEDSSKAVV